MSKAKGETARRQLGRISTLERRLRQLLSRRFQSDSQIAEISAIEWALPILEQHVIDNFGELPMRTTYYKHERRAVKSALWDRDGQNCYLCNKPMHYSATTIDHVVPLSKGGKDDMSNFKLTHSLCNIQKGNMTLEHFMEFKGKVLAA